MSRLKNNYVVEQKIEGNWVPTKVQPDNTSALSDVEDWLAENVKAGETYRIINVARVYAVQVQTVIKSVS